MKKTLTTTEYNKEVKALKRVGKKLSFKEYTSRLFKLDRAHALYKAEQSQPTLEQMERGRDQAPKKVKSITIAKLSARDFVFDQIGGSDGLERLVTKVFQQAIKGSFKHQELLMNYLLGKPMDRIKLEASGVAPASISPVVKIIADTIRLDKLNKDYQATITDPDRIKEMEDLLNKEVNGNVSHI